MELDENQRVTYDKIKLLPKAELHAHISGSVSYETLSKFAKTESQKDKLRLWFDNDFKKFTPTLKQIFDAFAPMQDILSDELALKSAIEDIVRSYSEENVKYLELRTTPKELPSLSAEKFVSTVVETLMQSEQKYAIKCRLLLSVNTRHSAQASEKVLKMAAADSSGYIVGVDLSGPPVEDLNISTIVHVLRGAKSTGLKVSAHICEIDESKDKNSFSLAEALLQGGVVDRIAHGTYLFSRPDLSLKVIDAKLPVEICPTSNFFTSERRFTSCRDLHFDELFQIGHPVAICCDDRGLFKCSLTDEFLQVASDCSLTMNQIQTLAKDSFTFAFNLQ
ncbi:adenosine deaminase-like protein [Symsagittifera roscoffensis]|uniref:adenosine deaminase-like protein n=1 Tax=Symsagittifera roscoffensis TaxID=84072 RepID=UPI00307CA9D6